MISHFLGRPFLNRRTTHPRGKPPETTSAVGRLIRPFGRSKLCWEAQGTPRDQYQDALRLRIKEKLDELYRADPAGDRVTFSFYMIGESAEKALPTLLFISKNPELREGARKAIKESGILSEYPDFRTKSVSKDPNFKDLVELASLRMSATSQSIAKIGTEVLFNSSLPIEPLGLPIFIQHASSLRPATANAIWLRGRVYLQTVEHAFRDHSALTEKRTTLVDDDLEIDSDSDSEDDLDDEVSIAITSIGSRSPDTMSDRGSSESGSSRCSSIFSASSTPKASLEPADTKSTLDDATAKLAPFAFTSVEFESSERAVPLRESLHPLGKLLKGWTEEDCALVEITDPVIAETLARKMKKSESGFTAYGKPADRPEADAEIYAYTASGGKLEGILSGTSSHTRLPRNAQFNEVYTARLSGPLSNGDCGSAVIDSKTGKTYGHIVAGCRSTGIAYVLAAHQVAPVFAELQLQHDLEGKSLNDGPLQGVTKQQEPAQQISLPLDATVDHSTDHVDDNLLVAQRSQLTLEIAAWPGIHGSISNRILMWKLPLLALIPQYVHTDPDRREPSAPAALSYYQCLLFILWRIFESLTVWICNFLRSLLKFSKHLRRSRSIPPDMTYQIPVHKKSVEDEIRPTVISLQKDLRRHQRHGGNVSVFVEDPEDEPEISIWGGGSIFRALTKPPDILQPSIWKSIIGLTASIGVLCLNSNSSSHTAFGFRHWSYAFPPGLDGFSSSAFSMAAQPPNDRKSSGLDVSWWGNIIACYALPAMVLAIEVPRRFTHRYDAKPWWLLFPSAIALFYIITWLNTPVVEHILRVGPAFALISLFIYMILCLCVSTVSYYGRFERVFGFLKIAVLVSVMLLWTMTTTASYKSVSEPTESKNTPFTIGGRSDSAFSLSDCPSMILRMLALVTLPVHVVRILDHIHVPFSRFVYFLGDPLDSAASLIYQLPRFNSLKLGSLRNMARAFLLCLLVFPILFNQKDTPGLGFLPEDAKPMSQSRVIQLAAIGMKIAWWLFFTVGCTTVSYLERSPTYVTRSKDPHAQSLLLSPDYSSKRLEELYIISRLSADAGSSTLVDLVRSQSWWHKIDYEAKRKRKHSRSWSIRIKAATLLMNAILALSRDFDPLAMCWRRDQIRSDSAAYKYLLRMMSFLDATALSALIVSLFPIFGTISSTLLGKPLSSALLGSPLPFEEAFTGGWWHQVHAPALITAFGMHTCLYWSEHLQGTQALWCMPIIGLVLHLGLSRGCRSFYRWHRENPRVTAFSAVLTNLVFLAICLACLVRELPPGPIVLERTWLHLRFLLCFGLFSLHVLAVCLPFLLPTPATWLIRNGKYHQALGTLLWQNRAQPDYGTAQACEELLRNYVVFWIEEVRKRNDSVMISRSRNNLSDAVDAKETRSPMSERARHSTDDVDIPKSIPAEVVMGINAFLLRETENWKREYTEELSLSSQRLRLLALDGGGVRGHSGVIMRCLGDLPQTDYQAVSYQWGPVKPMFFARKTYSVSQNSAFDRERALLRKFEASAYSHRVSVLPTSNRLGSDLYLNFSPRQTLSYEELSPAIPTSGHLRDATPMQLQRILAGYITHDFPKLMEHHLVRSDSNGQKQAELFATLMSLFASKKIPTEALMGLNAFLIKETENWKREYDEVNRNDYFLYGDQTSNVDLPLILTLDGGGVRGYSSLLILKNMLNLLQVEKQVSRRDSRNRTQSPTVESKASQIKEQSAAQDGSEPPAISGLEFCDSLPDLVRRNEDAVDSQVDVLDDDQSYTDSLWHCEPTIMAQTLDNTNDVFHRPHEYGSISADTSRSYIEPSVYSKIVRGRPGAISPFRRHEVGIARSCGASRDSSALDSPRRRGLSMSWRGKRLIGSDSSRDEFNGLQCSLCLRQFSGEYRKRNLIRHFHAPHSESRFVCPSNWLRTAKLLKRHDARLKHYRRGRSWHELMKNDPCRSYTHDETQRKLLHLLQRQRRKVSKRRARDMRSCD